MMISDLLALYVRKYYPAMRETACSMISFKAGRLRHFRAFLFPVRVIALTVLGIFVAGCVSSAVNTNDFRPVGQDQPGGAARQISTSSSPQANAAAVQPVNLVGAASGGSRSPTDQSDQTNLSAYSGNEASAAETADMRSEGVRIIRDKAAGKPGLKPQVGPLPTTATSQFTPSEQQAKIRELSAAAAASQEQVRDAEIRARRREFQVLRRKASSHYRDALKGIED
jgi:hypothetical protein